MSQSKNLWDYLVVSASHKNQAAFYESQIKLRKNLDLIPEFRHSLVVSDPEGCRIGSGGSTIYCLMQVVEKEQEQAPLLSDLRNPSTLIDTLKGSRILIIHAGGDSRRLSSYSACGKIFIPLPGESKSVVERTLFDRIVDVYKKLPEPASKKGQIVVATGDVVLDFDPEKTFFHDQGVTGLGCLAEPGTAKNHGVFCVSKKQKKEVRVFLQKPSIKKQKKHGALDHQGKSILDIGILNIDFDTMSRLFELCEVSKDSEGKVNWNGPVAQKIMDQGMNLYREFCCSLGSEVDFSFFCKAVRESSSKLPTNILQKIFDSLKDVSFYLNLLPRCGFYHFGDVKQIIQSGLDVLKLDSVSSPKNKVLSINNVSEKSGIIKGKKSWVEGCRLRSSLTLKGENVVVGVNVNQPLELPRKACLDVIPGKNKLGERVYFIRCYGVNDDFKAPDIDQIDFCGYPLKEWLREVGAGEGDIWPEKEPDKTLWTACMFPAIKKAGDFGTWIWMVDPKNANGEKKKKWLQEKRYSLREIFILSDQKEFQKRRQENRFKNIGESPEKILHPESVFSAKEMAYILKNSEDEKGSQWITSLINHAHTCFHDGEFRDDLGKLNVSRILHTLGSALLLIKKDMKSLDMLKKAYLAIEKDKINWLESMGLSIGSSESIEDWAEKSKGAAFSHLRRTIVLGKDLGKKYPKNALRSDEIIWVRAPARLDLSGGWTDTPPYSLEKGGCVINAAVNLNGQPPIHVYVRVSQKPHIKINSIDHGESIRINRLEQLLDYKSPSSQFSLAKAALVLCGFSPEEKYWPGKVRELQDMLNFFGGGIEITTLAAIPSGSGLGTSSIMGAAMVSALHRMMGRPINKRELFYRVLQLEQELTTGGGWQDQIGGSLGGVKVISTEPGIMPDPIVNYIDSDVLDPMENRGHTLLFYTGMRRLAKNILHSIVGHYLDRNRRTILTLKRIHEFPSIISNAMLSKDIQKFGEAVDKGWDLKKEIDPESTNERIEKMVQIFAPYIHGATMLGAGGGGFILLVCKSAKNALRCKETIEKDPPNERTRFFDFSINNEGLDISSC